MANLSKHNYLKMFTPRTPSMGNVAVWFISMMLWANLGISQGNKHEIKAISDYQNSLLEHYGVKYDLANYSVKEVKKKWWYWLPNVGFTFGLPHVSLNTNQLAVFDKQNEERKLKQLEIHQDYKIQFNEGLAEIRRKYRLIELKQIELSQEIRKFIIIESIYKIEKSAFNKEGSTPLEKLKADLVFEESSNYLNMLERQIEIMILDLEIYSFYNIPNQLFRESLDECILESKEFVK